MRVSPPTVTVSSLTTLPPSPASIVRPPVRPLLTSVIWSASLPLVMDVSPPTVAVSSVTTLPPSPVKMDNPPPTRVPITDTVSLPAPVSMRTPPEVSVDCNTTRSSPSCVDTVSSCCAIRRARISISSWPDPPRICIVLPWVSKPLPSSAPPASAVAPKRTVLAPVSLPWMTISGASRRPSIVMAEALP